METLTETRKTRLGAARWDWWDWWIERKTRWVRDPDRGLLRFTA